MTKNKHANGFTLVELLVVMVIIGLGFVSLSPSLADKTIKGDGDESFFNELVQSQLKSAKELNRQVFVKGTIGSENLLLSDGTTVKIPLGKVNSIKVNDKSVSGIEYFIYFYPDGVFDDFEMETEKNKTVQSYPLLGIVVVK